MTRVDSEWRGRIITEYRLKCEFCDAHISTGHRKATINAAKAIGWKVEYGRLCCPVHVYKDA